MNMYLQNKNIFIQFVLPPQAMDMLMVSQEEDKMAIKPETLV